ncbi:MAG: hypothetical protein K5897_12605 [Eubacterium sp.]|nr:hypothetical protein [Eubacterium sp.]
MARKVSTAATTAKKPAATTAKKPAAKKPAVKKPTTVAAKKPAAKKTTTAKKSSMQVTATEKRLVELYRKADSDQKKAALALLRGNKVQTGGILGTILGDQNLLGGLADMIPGFDPLRELPE